MKRASISRLACLFVFALSCLVPHLDAQTYNVFPSTPITTSGQGVIFNNTYRLMNLGVEETLTATSNPATISIIIQGCSQPFGSGVCDTLDTNTTVASSFRSPTISKPYASFTVNASWTGGSGVSIGLGGATTASKPPGGGGGGAVASVFGRTGGVVATAGDYTCALVTNCTSPPASANLLGSNGSSQLIAASAHSIALTTTCADSSGSATAQSCTPSPAITPAADDCFIYTTTTVNTGALTININGLGAKSVVKWLGTALAAGDIPANKPVPLCYDGTNLDVMVIGNAPSGGGGGTTTNAVTFNNGGAGAASGTSFNGASAVTVSYNTLGAVPTTTTVNGHALSANVTVTASDVGSSTAQWNANQINSVALSGLATGLLKITTGVPSIAIASDVVSLIQGLAGCNTASNVFTPQASDCVAQTSGFSNPMTTLGDLIYENATPASARLAGPTATNGVTQFLTSVPSGGAATAPAWAPGGVVPNPQTGTTYTVLATDRLGYVSFSNASAIAVTLPQPGTTGFASNFAFVACDIGAGTATITPTTSTISSSNGSTYTSAASTLALTTGQCAWIYSDNTNYFAIVRTGGAGSGTVTSVAQAVPSWLSVAGSPVTTSGTLAISAATGQTSHQVIGTCGTATSFAPCALVAGDIPTGIPIGNVGSAGLSGTAPITISAAGAIGCATCVTSAAALTNNQLVFGAGSQATAVGDLTGDVTTSGGKATTIAANAVTLAKMATQANATFLSNVSGATAVPSANALPTTANALIKTSNANGALAASLTTDDGTTSTYTGTGGTKSPVFTANGTTAGFMDYSQGTTSAAVAPCNTATSICEQAPTAVTSYLVTKPGAAGTGVRVGVNASNVVTENFSSAFGAVKQNSQTASIPTATLCAATANTACGQAGQYRIHWNFWGSGTACSSVTAGSVALTLTWTDENAVAHTAIAVPMWDQKSSGWQTSFFFNTALGTEGASGDYTISTNGSVIQYATTYTACTTGTGTYNLRMTTEQLQ